MFQQEEVDEGDERLAVDPWKGQIFPPSGFKETKDMSSPPDENLQIEWAFGYRAFDCRQNLKYTAKPDVIVYNTAALGVALNKKTNTQMFFNQHDDDIVSLDIHPNGDLVATG